MKMATRVALIVVATAGTILPSHGDTVNRSATVRRLTLKTQSRQRQVQKHMTGLQRGYAHYGDTACPCIGFDNIKGTTVVSLSGDSTANYPADLGARCETWDDGRHPKCLEGQDPGLGIDWCAESWCYVDPCNCNIDILPKMTAYIPDAKYRSKPLFYSYATCKGKDSFTTEVPEVGHLGCRCIGFDDIPGTTEISFEGGQMVSYPAEIGGTCRAWDRKTHPECNGKDAPTWCRAKWCYVDPCSCDLPRGEVPKISAYLPKATFTGKNLYYSYETCGDADTWTEKGNPNACVNQETKPQCDEQDRCTWTGTRCLGTELVDHPLCEEAGKRFAEQEKNSAAGRAPFVVLASMMAMSMAAMF